MRDGQRVALNAVLMFVKQGVMAVLGVVFVGYLARKTGVSDWGEFQASLAITSMVTVIAGMGVRSYLAREIAVRPELGPRHLGAALTIRGVTGTVLLGATVIVALATESGIGATLVALAAVSQLATLLYSTMWLSFEAHERFQYILYAELGARLFVIALASALLALGHGIVVAATAFLLGNVLELALTYWLVRTRLYRPELGTPLPELWRVTKASIPIGLFGALATALLQTDRVLLRFVCDEEAVGVYSAAWVLSEQFRMIPDVFFGAAFAAGMRLYAHDQEAFAKLYKNCMTVAVLLGLPVATGVVVLAPDIIHLVYGSAQGYAPAATVLRILVCQVPLAFAFHVGMLPMLAAKREVDMVKLLLVSFTANVLLGLVLMPQWRAAGAAAATLAVSVGSLVASMAMTARWTRLVDMQRVCAVAGATALMACAAWGARHAYGMWAAIAVGVPTYLALLVALRAVSREELRGLLRRRVPAAPAPAT